MKKILISVLVMFLLLGIVNAETRTYQDKFTNGKKIQSEFQEIQYGESLYFNKMLEGKNNVYNISCYDKAFDEKYRYSNVAIEIKIDDNPVQYLEIKNTDVRDMFGSVMIGCTTKSIQSDIINQIVNANRIAVKVYKENRNPKIFILPKDILTEWKEIINTKE